MPPELNGEKSIVCRYRSVATAKLPPKKATMTDFLCVCLCRCDDNYHNYSQLNALITITTGSAQLDLDLSKYYISRTSNVIGPVNENGGLVENSTSIGGPVFPPLL